MVLVYFIICIRRKHESSVSRRGRTAADAGLEAAIWIRAGCERTGGRGNVLGKKGKALSALARQTR